MNCSLTVRLRLDVNVILIDCFGTVWSEADPDRILALSLNSINDSSMFEAFSPGKTADGGPPKFEVDSSIRTPPQPVSTGTEPTPVEDGRTTNDSELVAVLPALSVTTSEITCVPLSKDCETGLPVLPFPERFQL